ncbi:alpha/beta fold hydrolase, partial [Bacteroides fragilis]|nr:alpha/beta fold hydrolase [Bacteroides fragilis]
FHAALRFPRGGLPCCRNRWQLSRHYAERYGTCVRSATGSDKVNLVGHSQGGLHTKTFTQLYGSPEEVSRVVAIGGNYHGTTLSGMGPA